MQNRIKKLLRSTVRFGNMYAVPILLFVITLAALFISRLTVFDPDNGFQIAHARVILSQGFVTEEPLTMHTGLSFMIPQWATAMLIWFLYTKLGVVAMNLVFLLFTAGTEWIMYKTGVLVSKNRTASALAVWVCISLYLMFLYAPRPHTISMFLIALEIYALEQYKAGRRKYIWMLPAISVALINFHNSLWLFVIVAALPYVAEFIWYKKGPEKVTKEVMTASVLTILCGVVNPYGLKAPMYIVSSMKSIEAIAPYIIEMMPTGSNGHTIVSMAIPLATVLALLQRKEHEPIPIRYYLLWAGTLLLAIMNVRSWVQFLVCGCPMLICAIKGFDIKVEERCRWNYGALLPAVMIVLVPILTMFGDEVPGGKTKEDIDTCLQYVKENISKDAVIFNSLNTGSYLEYYGYKPYIDTRNEVFGISNNGKFDYTQEYIDVGVKGINPEGFLKNYGFDTLIIQNNQCEALVYYAEQSGEWDKVYNGPDAAVYRTRGK